MLLSPSSQLRLSCLVLLLVSSRALAGEVVHDEVATELIGPPLRFGAFFGWHATGDLDVVGERVVGNEPDAGPAFGLRLGLRATATLGVDLSVGAVPAGPEWLLPVVLEARWRPLDGVFTPTVALGGGIYAGLGEGGDVDALFSGGLGAEVKITPTIVGRVDFGLWVSDGIASALAFDPVVTIGVDLLAYREHTRVADDGPRPLPSVKGCPAGVPAERCGNVDEDAFIDAFDRCPLVPGTKDGCPDADGDGIIDLRDGCPTKKGAASDWGCPR